MLNPPTPSRDDPTHPHHHDEGSSSCGCCKVTTGVGSGAFAETLEQMAFSLSMSGFLVRGASPAQIAAHVRETAHRLVATCRTGSSLSGDAVAVHSWEDAAAALVNSRDPSTGYTAIHHATRPQQADRLRHCEVLVSFGADVAASTPAMGWTALHRIATGSTAASLEEDVQLVQFLIRSWCAIVTPNAAAAPSHVDLLLRMQDAQGNTPHALAQRLRYPRCELLVAALSPTTAVA